MCNRAPSLFSSKKTSRDDDSADSRVQKPFFPPGHLSYTQGQPLSSRSPRSVIQVAGSTKVEGGKKLNSDSLGKSELLPGQP